MISEIRDVQRKGGELSQQEFKQAVRHASHRTRPGGAATGGEGYDRPLSELFLDGIAVPLKRRRLSPITAGQKRYIEEIRNKDIVFGIGPAGTGKTYLAVAMAVSALMAGKVSRIILCRPAVEAGEKLGFLPGDLKEKLDPYVRPLYDALYEMMDAEKIRQALDTGVIEIAPLAFMRGRTLNNSFVILDEGQNTSPEQMKMFLTRLGFESKAVVTGDVTQIDLPRGTVSGLVHVQKVLSSIEGIGFTFFDEQDVVRHDLVMKIVRAYEQHDNSGGKGH
ncbi:PhoH family protein [Candidatus Sumerlaeota bacterium]|nr:PhoH family protein [Candidatus Sumerlaeota bacterium]